MIKEREFDDFEDEGPAMDEDEDYIDSEVNLDDGESDSLLTDADNFQSRRSWRDTEKYKEMRELYKIINDELYTGFDSEEYFENED